MKEGGFMLKLKELRKKSGLSQQELAQKLDVTQATLSGWENEKYEIDNASLLKCASIFNVSVDYILAANIEPEELKTARAKTKALHETHDIPTISAIEEKTGTNYNTFRGWYNGYGDYFNDKLYLIADLYDVSVDYLLGREESPKIIGKDEKEIEKIIENTIENLSNTDGLMFDGEVPATEEEIEQLKAAMRIGLAMAKEKARQKFTPKKYRKDNQTDNK